MSSTVILVGGSHDGFEITFTDDVPPPTVHSVAPVVPSLHGEGSGGVELIYEPVHDEFGRSSRDDRGRWRYRYVPEKRR